MKNRIVWTILATAIATSGMAKESEVLEKIKAHRSDDKVLAKMLPIVQCPFKPTKYEEILLSQLRSTESSTEQFRLVSEKIGDVLVGKVIECLPTKGIQVQTPLTTCPGKALTGKVELVSIMRSGDALLDTFMKHFPDANISKILIQRDEKTAKPHFKYMKISPEIGSGNSVVITEPMIATGGTLEMVITLLKEKGVKEENIIVASICAAPEGIVFLSEKFPKIKVVMTALDEKLDERKFIVPGLGDFGDRFFGTPDNNFTAANKAS